MFDRPVGEYHFCSWCHSAVKFIRVFAIHRRTYTNNSNTNDDLCYDNFKIKSVSKLDKNATIVVYCSVGYRSGKIGKKLREAGFTSVFNLYGGLFDWANNGNPIYSKKGVVKKVHPYNAKWGKWLKPELRSKLD